MSRASHGIVLPPDLARDDAWFGSLRDELQRTLTTLNAALIHQPSSSAARIALALLPYQLDELVSLRTSDLSSDQLTPTSDINLAELMELAAVASRPLTTAFPFRTSVEPTDLRVVAPHSWVFRILTNLVSNSIKHSGGDHVELSAESLRGKIVLNVRDNGRGISHDLVTRFYASTILSDTTAHSLGTLRGGRGIATAILLAKAMNGKIECISTKSGTHWRVHLDPRPVLPCRVPARLREDLGWLNGVVHDMRQPLTHLSARFAVGEPDSLTRMAVTRLPYLFDEVIALINANILSHEPSPSESFSLQDVMEAGAGASVPLGSAAPVPLVHQNNLTVVCPKSWVFRIVTNLCATCFATFGSSASVRASYEEGQVFIDVSPQEPVDLCLSRLALASTSHAFEVTRRLARAMGGDVYAPSASSSAPKWRVALGIPVLSLPSFFSEESRGASLDGKLVVVLDDNFDLAVNVAARFEELGAVAMVFTSDLDMLASTAHMDTPPDLFVLDFMLDERSGGEHDRFVTRAIAKLRRRRHPSHLVILTDHPNHPGLREIDPPIPVFTKLLSDMHFRALVSLLRGDIHSLDYEAIAQVPSSSPSSGPAIIAPASTAA